MAANGMTVTEVQAYHTEDSPRTEAHPAHAFQAVPWLPWQHVRVPTAIVPSGCRGVLSQQSRVVKSAPSAATGSRPSRLASSSIPTIQSGARSRPTDGSGGCGGCDGAAVSTSNPVGEDAPASADLTRERHTTIVSPRRLDAAFAARRHVAPIRPFGIASHPPPSTPGRPCSPAGGALSGDQAVGPGDRSGSLARLRASVLSGCHSEVAHPGEDPGWPASRRRPAGQMLCPPRRRCCDRSPSPRR
jgi:hypothetical protein